MLEVQFPERSTQERMADADVARLLEIAGIAAGDKEAAAKLRSCYQDARSWVRQGAVVSPIPAEHNPPLERVRNAADELIAALVALDAQYPHANLALWLNEAWSSPLFVPAHDVSDAATFKSGSLGEMRDDARASMVAALRRMSRAASEGRKVSNGRPTQVRKKIVQCAFDFFVRCSHERPTASPGGRFWRFTVAFYEVVSVTDDTDGGDIMNRAIRDVIKTNKRRVEATFLTPMTSRGTKKANAS